MFFKFSNLVGSMVEMSVLKICSMTLSYLGLTLFMIKQAADKLRAQCRKKLFNNDNDVGNEILYNGLKKF